MSSISVALEKGFVKYYNTLTKLGNVDIHSVNNLIVASWINDVLEGRYGFLVDDEQYMLLNQLYMCIEGSCLVPYQNYCNDFVVNKLPNLDANTFVRLTENSTTRILEDNNIRTI